MVSFFFRTFVPELKRRTAKSNQAGQATLRRAKSKPMSSVVTDGDIAVSVLLDRVSKLEASVGSLSSDNSRLNRRIGILEKENASLKKENASLKERLSKYEKPRKDSHNSSIPPSREDIAASQTRKALRRTESLRQKSDRPSGGQKGHEGHTLESRALADRRVLLQPQACPCCGKPLAHLRGTVVGYRQVIDIPLPRPETTEYDIVEKECECGCKVRGEYPKGVNAPVMYGSNIQSLVVYLGEGQHMPYDRLAKAMNEVFGLKMSQGTIDNIIRRTTESARPVYEEIRSRLEHEPVAGADESGEDVNGNGEWLWTVQSPRYTYLMSEPSRGKGVMDKHFPNGLPNTILVTDRLPLYFKLNTKGHQICLAHLLRNLKYLDELDTSQDWSKRMGRLLRDAIHQRKHKSWEQIDRKGLMERLKELLAESVEKLDEEFGKLQRSLRKLQDYVFTFLFNKDIPSDNNASEGAIRKAKIKMKVSQAFRSRAGAESFAVLHSIMDTAKKNGMPIFQAVRSVVEYQPIALPE